MLDKVRSFIRSNCLIEKKDRIVAGISGGADSTCLLHMLIKLNEIEDLNIEISVVHVEHGIRGKESLDDAKFVESLCNKLGIAFKQYNADALSCAAALKISTEEAARKVRYEAFEKAASFFNANKVALAHNLEDNAETMLLNLTRGTGLDGICGIPAKRGHFIRPLIVLSRMEIEEYLHSHGIGYRTDSTNLMDEYSRNKIRHHAMPVLSEINKKYATHFFNAANLVQLAAKHIENEVLEHLNKSVKYNQNKGSCEIDALYLGRLDFFIRCEIIKKAAALVSGSKKDIGLVHIRGIESLLSSDCGKSLSLPYSLTAIKAEGRVVIRHAAKDNHKSAFESGFDHFFKKEVISADADYKISTSRYIKDFDLEKVENALESMKNNNSAPLLTARFRMKGDVLVIDKNAHSKKLNRYFIDEKIPAFCRDQIPLLALNNEILWVTGYRISEKYKVDGNTKKILRISLNENGLKALKELY